MRLRERLHDFLISARDVGVDEPLAVDETCSVDDGADGSTRRTWTVCRVDRYFTAFTYAFSFRACSSDSLSSVLLSAWFTLSSAFHSSSAGTDMMKGRGRQYITDIPVLLSSFLHFSTLPTSDGVSLPASTSASMSLVRGGSLKGSTR